MRAISLLLVTAVALGSGCQFDMGALEGEGDGGPVGDGAVVGDAAADAARDGATDGPIGDGPRPDGVQTDVSPQKDAQNDVYVDPCETMDCDDTNPCTNDGCLNGVCQHNDVSGVACGAAGNVCLGGDCVPCGGQSGQVCCAGNVCTGPNLYCSSGTCQPCGGDSQPCCGIAPSCGTGLVCAGGKCEPCGSEWQRCCGSSPACDSADIACDPLTGYCLQCGGHYQVCCAGGACSSTYRCALGYCG